MDAIMDVSQRFPELWFSGMAVLGLSVGSFLNVVIYRLPVNIVSAHPDSTAISDLLYPPSHCTSCQSVLRWYDNLPLISWWVLKGKCRYCGQSVSWQYPLIEALSLMLCLFAGFLYPPGTALTGLLIFSWLLLALSAIDVNTLLLPDTLTLTLLWTGLFFNLNGTFVALSDAVAGAMAGYMVLRLLCGLGEQMFRKTCMGYGDCKMAAGLAAWTGWQSLPVLLLIASLFGLVYIITARMREKKTFDHPVPFGPALAAAGWLVLIDATC